MKQTTKQSKERKGRPTRAPSSAETDDVSVWRRPTVLSLDVSSHLISSHVINCGGRVGKKLSEMTTRVSSVEASACSVFLQCYMKSVWTAIWYPSASAARSHSRDASDPAAALQGVCSSGYVAPVSHDGMTESTPCLETATPACQADQTPYSVSYGANEVWQVI